MFARFNSFLFPIFFAFLFINIGSAQSLPCTDSAGKVIAGYVQPECAEEYAKFKGTDCNAITQWETKELPPDPKFPGLVRRENVLDANGQRIKKKQSPECEKLTNDLAGCTEQCIPQVTNGSILPGPKDGTTAKNYVVNDFLPNLTNGFLIFIMVLGVGFLVAAGFMWIFSAGNQELSSRALRTVIWTIIGLVVAVISYLLVQIVININFFA